MVKRGLLHSLLTAGLAFAVGCTEPERIELPSDSVHPTPGAVSAELSVGVTLATGSDRASRAAEETVNASAAESAVNSLTLFVVPLKEGSEEEEDTAHTRSFTKKMPSGSAFPNISNDNFLFVIDNCPTRMHLYMGANLDEKQIEAFSGAASRFEIGAPGNTPEINELATSNVAGSFRMFGPVTQKGERTIQLTSNQHRVDGLTASIERLAAKVILTVATEAENPEYVRMKIDKGALAVWVQHKYVRYTIGNVNPRFWYYEHIDDANGLPYDPDYTFSKLLNLGTLKNNKIAQYNTGYETFFYRQTAPANPLAYVTAEPVTTDQQYNSWIYCPENLHEDYPGDFSSLEAKLREDAGFMAISFLHIVVHAVPQRFLSEADVINAWNNGITPEKYDSAPQYFDACMEYAMQQNTTLYDKPSAAIAKLIEEGGTEPQTWSADDATFYYGKGTGEDTPSGCYFSRNAIKRIIEKSQGKIIEQNFICFKGGWERYRTLIDGRKDDKTQKLTYSAESGVRRNRIYFVNVEKIGFPSTEGRQIEMQINTQVSDWTDAGYGDPDDSILEPGL